MKYTNKHNLPQPVYTAIANDPYEPGRSDISTTTLIGPPRIAQLKKRYKDQIIEDIIDNVWSLIGSNTHHILERIDTMDCIKEVRYYAEFNGWVVGGQIDLYETESAILSDYKVTSVWSVIHGLKPEHEQQLNVNAHLMRKECKIYPEKLQIVSFLRDWSKFKASEPNYPDCQVHVQSVPMWHRDEAERFINHRVQLHQSAAKKTDNELPLCTPEERWEEPTKYAVMKKGRKSAVRVLGSKKEAEDYIKLKELKIPPHSIYKREGKSKRCEYYCSVNKFCSQYQKMKKGE